MEVVNVDILCCFRENADLAPEAFQYVEMVYGPEVERLRQLLSSKHYDAVYVCRPSIGYLC
jgi:hypothetical protein